MTSAAQTSRRIASSGRDIRPPGVALIAACAGVDAIAAGILLLGTPLSGVHESFAVAASHATAALLASRFAGSRPSRRWLCVAAVLAIPCAGVAVAIATFVTRGRGTITIARRRKTRRRAAPTAADIGRLGCALSPCDALDGGDEEQRRTALTALSGRADPEAIVLLRRVAAGCEPDLALSAALALDGISERAERQMGGLNPGGRT